MRYIVHVPAGSTVRQPFSGQNLVLADAGAAGAVTIGLIGASTQDVDTLGVVGKGFALFLPDRKFSGVELSASVDTVVELIVTDYRVTITDGLSFTIDAAQLPLPVQVVGVTPTDRSGTITVAATSQQLMAANAARRGLWVQNLSTADLWLREGAAATQAQPSIKLAAGGMYESPAGGCPVSSIAIIGPTVGQAFSAREW